MVFVCRYPGCGMQVDNEASLANHASNTHGAEPLACGHGGLLLSDQSSLTRHRDMHLNPQKFPCMVCAKSFHRVDSLASHFYKLHFPDIWQFSLNHGYLAHLAAADQPVLAVINQPAPVNQVAPPMYQPAMANHFGPMMHHAAPPNLFPHAMHPSAPADHFNPATQYAVPMNPRAPGFQQPAAQMDEPMQLAVQQPASLLYQAAPADNPQTANQQSEAEYRPYAPAN